jgi:hypothetical protein
MADGYDDIGVEFSLAKTDFEDIGIVIEWNKIQFEDILLSFEIQRPGYYNYADAHILFQVMIGNMYQDVPILFSITRAVQSFLSYIMQKLYITCSEILGANNDQEILEWNVSPNKTWFVQVTGDLVILYDTQADMEQGTNPVAYGYVDDNLHVVLVPADEYDQEVVSLYYQDLLYHLALSNVLDLDEYDEYDVATRYFKVKPVTDLSEIRHPIYNNSNIVLMRGEAELNLHTFCRLSKELVLGVHLPSLESGNIVSYASARRNKTEKSQVLSQTIAGNPDSIITTIQVATYMELTRR